MDSGDHLHSGVVAVVWVTVAAIVGFNVVRLAAGKLALSSNSGVASFGKAAGALVHFGG